MQFIIIGVTENQFWSRSDMPERDLAIGGVSVSLSVFSSVRHTLVMRQN